MGAGPYPTEIFGPLAEELRELGGALMNYDLDLLFSLFYADILNFYHVIAPSG